MKKLLFIFPVILVATFANCKKAKGPASVPSVQPNNSADSLRNMSALINLRPWQTDSAFSYKVKQSGNDSGIVNLMITATRRASDTSTMVFNINNYTGPATYAVNPPITAITYYAGGVRHFATSGSFTVISDTGQILKGKFNFVADSMKVTEGNFVVALP